MSLTNPHLATLADYLGIARDYHDWKGQYIEVGEVTVIAVLDGLGIDASTPERAERACHKVANRAWVASDAARNRRLTRGPGGSR